MKTIIITFLFAALSLHSFSQSDSLAKKKPLKIRHAEPLYMDLIRDLGARKDEKEWNVGYGLEGQKQYTINTAFVEYEFSPVNRLGLEIEIPLAFYRTSAGTEVKDIPRNRIEGIKLAAQYTFLVSEKQQMSMAAGYIHELRAHSFYSIDHGRGMLKGHTASPFLIVAKKWSQRINTMLYTGPEWEFIPQESRLDLYYQINASAHYVLPAGHFVGLEVNDEISNGRNHTVLRPQVKLVLNQNLALGLVTGIPASLRNDGMSFMARIIFEPPSRK